jgi:Nucleotidyltransferase of unknown function (DUF6036)
MTSEEATLRVIDALEAAGIPCMLVGSFSSNYHGIPRSTEDADIVIVVPERPLADILAPLEPAFRLDPQLSFESITFTPRQVIEVPELPFRIELFHFTDDPHNQARFGRKLKVEMAGRKVWIPTAEDVIITKLRWARSKDRDDVRNVIAVQSDAIDWDYVHSWCDRHSTRALLDEIRASIPPI